MQHSRGIQVDRASLYLGAPLYRYIGMGMSPLRSASVVAQADSDSQSAPLWCTSRRWKALGDKEEELLTRFGACFDQLV